MMIYIMTDRQYYTFDMLIQTKYVLNEKLLSK